jgi:hypothetical protein
MLSLMVCAYLIYYNNAVSTCIVARIAYEWSLTCTNLLLSDADHVSTFPCSILALHFVISLCKFRSSLTACELTTVGILGYGNKRSQNCSGSMLSNTQLAKPPTSQPIRGVVRYFLNG